MKYTRSLVLSILIPLLVVCGFLLSAGVAQATSLDPTFGSGGVTVTDVFNNDFGTKALIQPDGKIIVVGYQYTPCGNCTAGTPESALMIRYNADGSLDASFGTGGKVRTSAGYPHATAYSGALQTDGKIILVGQTITPPFGFAPADFLVMRFNSNGTLDTSFNGSGIATVDAGSLDVAQAVVVQPDGKILVAGYQWVAGPNATAVVRLNSDGSVDTGFGTNGKRNYFDNPGGTNATDIILQPDGRIILCEGSFNTALGTQNNFRLRRLKGDGTDDASFGTSGLVDHDFGGDEAATSLALLADGRLLVGGVFNADFIVARFNSNGSLDTSFGTGGKTTTDFFGLYDSIRDLAILADGKIVCVGGAAYSGSLSRFALALYNADGSFNEKLTTIINTSDAASSVAVQSDGKLVVTGFTSYDPLGTRIYDVAVARYVLSTGATHRVPFDFDGDGKAETAVYRPGMMAESFWLLIRSSDQHLLMPQFGTSGDVIVPADYNGDGRTELAVFRPASGNWYFTSDLLNSQTSYQTLHWGQNGDLPVPGDYDGDGRADFSIFRPSNGTWYIRQSSNGAVRGQQFGIATDLPIQADYDGDGKTDIAVLRQLSGNLYWYILRSSDNGFVAEQFGASGDRAVPADYTGDGKADVAVFRPSTGTWYTSLDPATNYGAFQWGQNGDIPAPADYDGDGRADFSVFRPSNSYTYTLHSSNSSFTATQLGISTDIPVASAYVR